MKQIVFGRWGHLVRDYRRAETDPDQSSVAEFPPTSLFPENLAAVMSGKGLMVFQNNFNFVSMVREYVRAIQEKYCCGRCLTGIKGTHLLLVTLDRMADGNGVETDLDTLAKVSDVLDTATRCSVCQSAGELVKDGLKYYLRDFSAVIESGLDSDTMTYFGKLSAPCMNACPCHINVPGYVEALQEVRYGESLKIIRADMPLPGVTGRICPAPCQKACTLANMDRAPIPIKTLKRVAADYEMAHKLTPPLKKVAMSGPPVAVIGAGPAGLAAAYYLNREGIPVTIFEGLPVLGGMVGVGVPPYRQPRQVLGRDISIISDLGVEIKDKMRLGRDFFINDLFEQGFKAVLLGIGTHQSISLGIKGEDAGYKGVFSGGIDFLRHLNLGRTVTVGDRVIIVGGGNTAIDCARTALRMGATEVHVVYRRTEKEMPSDPEEVEDAHEEGVIFHFLTQPIEIVERDGSMIGLRCLRMELGEADHSGRARPVPVEGSEFDIEADTLIPAIGQKADLSFLSPADGIEITRRGYVQVDEDTMMTTRPGVFAAGDAVSGPLTVVHGVAGGKRAAKMMAEYVTQGSCTVSDEHRLEKVIAAIEKDPKVFVTPRTESRLGSAKPSNKLDMRERISTFEEVESGFTQESSFIEASRCLRCFHFVFAAFGESAAEA